MHFHSVGCFVWGGRNGMGCFVRAAKMAWDVLSGLTKTAWDVLSGVANLCGMFCPGCHKMAWDVLSRDVLSYIHRTHQPHGTTYCALSTLQSV